MKERTNETNENENENENKNENGNERCPLPHLPPPLFLQVLREGGVVGVVEGLALQGRRLPPPEYLERGKEGERRGESETAGERESEKKREIER